MPSCRSLPGVLCAPGWTWEGTIPDPRGSFHVLTSHSAGMAPDLFMEKYKYKIYQIYKNKPGKSQEKRGRTRIPSPREGEADAAPRSWDGRITVSASSKVASPPLLVPSRPPSLPPSLLFPVFLPPERIHRLPLFSELLSSRCHPAMPSWALSEMEKNPEEKEGKNIITLQTPPQTLFAILITQNLGIYS